MLFRFAAQAVRSSVVRAVAGKPPAFEYLHALSLRVNSPLLSQGRSAIATRFLATETKAAKKPAANKAKKKPAKKAAKKKAPKKKPVKKAPKKPVLRHKRPEGVPKGPKSSWTLFILQYKSEHPELKLISDVTKSAAIAFQNLSTSEKEVSCFCMISRFHCLNQIC